jgi:hypothetical protein
MIRTVPVACVFVLLLPFAHVAEAQVRGATERKTASAVRVSVGAIEVDGRLDEAVWRDAQPITDFVQKEPVEGAPPTERMEVRFAYDNGALFVGARMFSRNPNAIQAPMSRRDDGYDQAEHVLVSFDTFLDRRTAYTFGVTAGGVRIDRYHSQDDTDFDAGFDPVWEARTQIDELGWTAELWIPFAQLRFNDVAEQIWGLNVSRFTPSLNEQDYWIAVPRTEQAWASRFGDLRGIGTLGSTRRIELLPVVVGSSLMNGQRDANNPFDTGQNLASRFGADMKMGLGPSLTMNVTINPDFGQVEADPAEVNLTAFATRFAERRPFFTENSQLFAISHPNGFYSRRIGIRPSGPASGDYVDYPENNTILAAGKITGRLRSGTSIGILSAVTGQEFARTSTGALIDEVRVAPRTMFGIARVQQEFGTAGSFASVMFGTAHRDMADGDPLAALLSKNALVLGGDTLMRFRRGQYELRSAVIVSHVDGTAKAMERIQRSSAHYMQRPDKTYATIDPTRTSLTGVSTQTAFERISGRHWLFGISAKVDTPTFDTNDIGQLNAADGIQPSVNVTYRETRPGKLLRNYSIRLNYNNEWNFGLERQMSTVGTNFSVTWVNFWTSSINVSRNARTQNASLTRGGPLMGTPEGLNLTINVGNRSTSPTRIQGQMVVNGNEMDGFSRRVNGTFSFRPGPQWQLSVRPAYDRTTDAQQYVQTLSGGRPETYGGRYIFAYIERSTVSTQFRLGYTLKPDVNVDFYAEPFAASGRYFDYGELAARGSMDRLTYGSAPGTTLVTNPDGSQTATIGGTTLPLSNRDFNVRSFRSNAVLRWEYRPGSTLYVVWQQNREARDVLGSRVDFGDMFRSVTAPGSNIFLVKTSFWIPVG